MQKCHDQRRDVCACFIDYEKAFDRVLHSKLIEVLKECGVDGKDIRIIHNLYWKQVAEVRAGDIVTPKLSIQRGVRQGCLLSPLLFNLYADRIFKEAVEDLDVGVRVNGERITSIKYADDTVLLAESLEDLQLLLNRLSSAGQRAGLTINIMKTKWMVFSRSSHDDAALTLNGRRVERVRRFKYLGCLINESMDPDMEVKCRIEKARFLSSSFHSLREKIYTQLTCSQGLK
uniref:Retrovirus-related Pol polyprotein LINE-1 n=1 Tax=Lygus hesperus TaxID=30085 RepID=A0A0A9XCE7_LYGHE